MLLCGCRGISRASPCASCPTAGLLVTPLKKKKKTPQGRLRSLCDRAGCFGSSTDHMVASKLVPGDSGGSRKTTRVYMPYIVVRPKKTLISTFKTPPIRLTPPPSTKGKTPNRSATQNAHCRFRSIPAPEACLASTSTLRCAGHECNPSSHSFLPTCMHRQRGGASFGL